MRLTKSKNVRSGCVVVLRGNKLCLARRNTKYPFGVYHEPNRIETKGVDMGGNKFHYHYDLPEGVSQWGKGFVKIAT